jgi:epoxide hydrolase-like predicted phosphatase
MENSDAVIKAVIFDMGGVILRTEAASARTELAKKFGMTRLELENVVFQSPESQKAELGEYTREEHWNNIARLLNFPREDQPEFQRMYWDGDREDVELVAFIRGLRKQYKTGMLSNAWHGALEQVARDHHFLSAFDVVIFSAEVHLRKPDPRIFHLMLARLGVKAGEAVFVDDFMANIEGAKTLGLKTVHFKSREGAIRELKELGVG